MSDPFDLPDAEQPGDREEEYQQSLIDRINETMRRIERKQNAMNCLLIACRPGSVLVDESPRVRAFPAARDFDMRTAWEHL